MSRPVLEGTDMENRILLGGEVRVVHVPSDWLPGLVVVDGVEEGKSVSVALTLDEVLARAMAREVKA